MTVRERLGARIRELREAKGWSARELAARAGKADTVVSKIESGQIANPGIFTIVDVAKALGVSVADLLRASTKPKEKKG